MKITNKWVDMLNSGKALNVRVNTNRKKHGITNPVFSNVDTKDAPHYVDAQLESCEIDGIKATEEQIELIPDEVKQELLYEQN